MYQHILKEIFNLYTLIIFILVSAPTVIAAAALTLQYLEAIADLFYRVCVIGLENLGNRDLTDPTWYISHGVVQNLPKTLPPNKAGVFTFQKTACKTIYIP